MYGATEELSRSAAVAEEAKRGRPIPVSGVDAPADARVSWLRVSLSLSLSLSLSECCGGVPRLQQCAPVIMQPQLDVQNGFGLRRVFFDFRPSERVCELSLVYDGEASYG